MPEIRQYPKKITLDDKIDVIRREIKMRKSVYPGRCFGPSAKMTEEEAAFQIGAMEEVLKDYELLKAKEGVQTNLF